MKSTIYLCGAHSVGKTSLVQAVTRSGTVPQQAISASRAGSGSDERYETDAAIFVVKQSLTAAPEKAPQEDADNLLSAVRPKGSANDSAASDADLIWYCLDASAPRLSAKEAKLIGQYADKLLLLVTKSDLLAQEQAEPLLRELRGFLPDEQIILVSSTRKTGLKQLIGQSEIFCIQSLTDRRADAAAFERRWTDYYAPLRALWSAKNTAQAQDLINWGAGRAAAIAFFPLPLADVGPLMLNEAYMIIKLGKLYGYAIDRSMAAVFAGVIGASIAGKTVASFLPFLKIPIAAAITYGVGKIARRYFESGMSLTLADAASAVKSFGNENAPSRSGASQAAAPKLTQPALLITEQDSSEKQQSQNECKTEEE